MDSTHTARVIARGFYAAHTLGAEHLAARAKAALADDSSTDLVRESLQWQSDHEAKVAAEFAAVADLLDRAPRAPMPPTYVFADAGGWVPGDDL